MVLLNRVAWWTMQGALILAACGGRCGVAGAPRAGTLTRGHEPVVLTGSQLPAVQGRSTNDIFVYAFRGDVWVQIPFQIDERAPNGSYYQPDDGVFDDNDEICFMAQDASDQVSTAEWVGGSDAARYEIGVRDGTDSTRQAWAYVYTSSSIWPGTTDYVNYDSASCTILARNYSMNFPDANHLHVMEGLRFTQEGGGDSVDILDRGKSRGQVAGQGFWITEEGVSSSLAGGGWKDGRVRVIMEFTGWAFGSDQVLRLEALYYKSYILTLSTISTRTTLGTLRHIRYSVDYNTAVSGLRHYNDYGDGGGNFALIDGVDDALDEYPLGRWIEVDHPTHGCYLLIQDFSPFESIAESISLFYQDGSSDPTGYDTGDSVLWGESGIYIVNSRDTVATVPSITYLLPADQQNVGDLYEGYYYHPLQIEPVLQNYTGIEGGREPRVVGKNGLRLALFPNPSSGQVTVQLLTPTPGLDQPRVAVYDLTGRAIRDLSRQAGVRNRGALVWNGCDDEGRRVAAGVYVVSVQMGSRRETRKVVLAR